MALTGRLPPPGTPTSRLDIRMIRLAVGVALALVAQSQAGSQEYSTRTPASGARRTVPAPTDSSAYAIRAETAPVIDGRDDDAVWRSRPADHGVPAMAAHRRKGAALPHRGEGRLRRREPVRVRARVRSPSRQHHQDPRAARHVHAVGHDLAVHRLVSRPAHRLRVRRERGRRQDGSGDLRRRQRRQRVGRACGTSRRGSTRSAGRPSSAFRSRRCATARDKTHTFGFTIDRDIYRYNERVSWPLFSQSKTGFVSQFGSLDGPRRPRGAAPPRGDAVRRHQERGEHRQQPLHQRAPSVDARRRPQVSRRVEPHARRDGQSGLRAGRVGSGGAQPVGVRVVLRRAPAVLRRRPRTVPLRRELQQRQLQQRGALLQPPHRPHAGAGRHVRRHRPAAADDDPRRREAARAIPERAHVRRARRDDAARVEPGRHDVRAGDELHGRAREAGSSRRQQLDRRDGHRGEPQRGSLVLAVPRVERVRRRGGLSATGSSRTHYEMSASLDKSRVEGSQAAILALQTGRRALLPAARRRPAARLQPHDARRRRRGSSSSTRSADST